MLGLLSVEVDANAGTANESGARVAGPDEDVTLVDKVQVLDHGEGCDVDDGDHAWIDTDEEGEGSGRVATQHETPSGQGDEELCDAKLEVKSCIVARPERPS